MNKKELQKENERLQKLVEILQEEKKSLKCIIMLQKTMCNPFTPWTNCYSDMMAKVRMR